MIIYNVYIDLGWGWFTKDGRGSTLILFAERDKKDRKAHVTFADHITSLYDDSVIGRGSTYLLKWVIK